LLDPVGLNGSFRTRDARFRRNVSEAGSYYTSSVMTYLVDIDPRIARFGLHAGRLHAGN
jgi:hypothetical protein